MRIDAGRAVVAAGDFLSALAGHIACHGEVNALLGEGGNGVGVVDVHLRAADVLALVDVPGAAYTQLLFRKLDDDTTQLAHFKVERVDDIAHDIVLDGTRLVNGFVKLWRYSMFWVWFMVWPCTSIIIIMFAFEVMV